MRTGVQCVWYGLGITIVVLPALLHPTELLDAPAIEEIPS
jgi:hypothetical protein